MSEFDDKNGVRWEVTRHAHKRYAQRVGDGALIEALARTERVKKRETHSLLRRCSRDHRRQQANGTPFFLLRRWIERSPAGEDRAVVFVIRRRKDRFVVLTCWAVTYREIAAERIPSFGF